MNKTILKLIYSSYLLMFFSNIQAETFEAINGKIYIPANDISGTATYYTFGDVKIFVARKSDGNIVSHRDACQACGPAGFIQNGTAMKCNACGLQYEIDNLGVDNPGTCWPFYISNSVEGDKIVFDQSELGVNIGNTPINKIPIKENFNIKLIKFSNLECSFSIPSAGNYQFALFNLSGKLIFSVDKTYGNGGIYTVKLRNKKIAKGEYVFAIKSTESAVVKNIIIK